MAADRRASAPPKILVVEDNAITLVSLNDVVREAVQLLGDQLHVDNVDLRLGLDEHVPVLWADPHELHQVVVNLISNAHQALRGTQAIRRVIVTTGSDGDEGPAWLEVADTGPGISDEVAARIFEPFFTTKPAGEGTGLGLSLCRGIVESHGGAIRLLKARGPGAVFRVEIPLLRPVRDVPAAETPPAFETTRASILVVDDERDVGLVLADLLAAEGHTVDVALNGAEALRMVCAGEYDLIVSDVRMPGLDGMAPYREIARRQPGLEPRFVFITGDTMGGDTAAFLERVGARSLAKPFNVEAVPRVVQEVMAGARRRGR